MFILEIKKNSPESLFGLFCQLNKLVYRHSQGVGITENHTLHICLSLIHMTYNCTPQELL